VISRVTAASGNKIECEGAYHVLFEIDKKKFGYNIHALKHLSDDLILGINLPTILEIKTFFGQKKPMLTGKLPNFNALPS
jgi:hypothetical protein